MDWSRPKPSGEKLEVKPEGIFENRTLGEWRRSDIFYLFDELDKRAKKGMVAESLVSHARSAFRNGLVSEYDIMLFLTKELITFCDQFQEMAECKERTKTLEIKVTPERFEEIKEQRKI